MHQLNLNYHYLWRYILNINPFVPNAPLPYPLKTSKNLTVFCFQEVEKGCIGNKWVNLSQTNLFLISKIWTLNDDSLFSKIESRETRIKSKTFILKSFKLNHGGKQKVVTRNSYLFFFQVFSRMKFLKNNSASNSAQTYQNMMLSNC